MKLTNHESHDHSEQKGLKHVPKRIKQYLQSLYNSLKYKSMSRGSCNRLRSMSWAHGENWRRNHQKSLNKQHKK